MRRGDLRVRLSKAAQYAYCTKYIFPKNYNLIVFRQTRRLAIWVAKRHGIALLGAAAMALWLLPALLSGSGVG
jgi:hypothetical protein